MLGLRLYVWVPSVINLSVYWTLYGMSGLRLNALQYGITTETCTCAHKERNTVHMKLPTLANSGIHASPSRGTTHL